jgi:hypothetical protein
MGAGSNYHRLSVNLNEESAEVLRSVTRSRGITTTEAIRRAIGLLAFFEDANRAGAKIVQETKDGVRQVHVL